MSLKSLSGGNSIVEFVLIVAIAIGLALLIQAFIVKPYRIPSGSMEPTLAIGQRVLVNRIGNTFSDPHVGEILVFHPPQGALEPVSCGVQVALNQLCSTPTAQEANVNFIKRVVAGPGDTIAVRDGHVIRNGREQEESFIRGCNGSPGCNFPTAIRIPAGRWFMMGDNRGDSEDSRFWGPIPKKWIIGGAFATYWPLGRLGIL
ncbi:MAG: signal peptidase I [Solirubrobacteraceae bacterium]